MKYLLIVAIFIFSGCGNQCKEKGFKGFVYGTGHGIQCSNGDMLNKDCIETELGIVCGEFLYERYER